MSNTNAYTQAQAAQGTQSNQNISHRSFQQMNATATAPLDQQMMYLQQPHYTAMSRNNSQSSIHHAIKRNLGSSTTSLTAFALSQQDKNPIPVSLSPFEYASPAASSTHYFKDTHHGSEKLGPGSLVNMDSEDLDFDTAYNMINESIDQFGDGTIQQQQQQVPSPQIPPHTPEPQLQSLYRQYKSPNTLSQQKYNDQQLYQDHRRAIIQAGLQGSLQTQTKPNSPQLQHQQPPSPFTVSPHTRSLLNSVNNMASAYQLSSSGYELLSLTESSALEKFLDSVVDDSKLSDLGRHWPSIDPLAKSDSEYTLPTLVTEGKKDKAPPSHQMIDLKLQNIDSSLHMRNPIPANHSVSLSYTASPSQSPVPDFYQAHPLSSIKNNNNNNGSRSVSSTSTPPIAGAQQTQEAPKKKRGRKKKSESEMDASKKQRKLDSEESVAKKKRAMLTEEQKKLNHTESEKKRRAMIKTSYDNLLATIATDKCYHIRFSDQVELEKKKNSKRGNSRFAVMNSVIREIEWLLESNQAMKKKLVHQTA